MTAERIRLLRGAVIAAYAAALVLGVGYAWRAHRADRLNDEVLAAADRLEDWTEALRLVRRARPLLERAAGPEQVDVDHVVRSAGEAGVEMKSMTKRKATETEPATVMLELRETPMHAIVDFLVRAERGPVRVADVWVRRPNEQVYGWNARVVFVAEPVEE